jgi:ubiquinone/menaquinone biosynthesis C-methylase UbiE
MVILEKIRKDFDRIAILSEHQNDPGGVYDRSIIGFVPSCCDRVLEIGCGTGSFTRLLAERANHITAIDLSAEMIRIARLRSANLSNISYEVGDFQQMDLISSHFDCIVMIATLHHLPEEEVLEKVRRALKPNGVVIIHDLLASSGIVDRGMDLMRLWISWMVRWKRTGREWARREERQAWAEHGKGERYLTINEVQAMRDRYLPEGEVKKHLLWRYSIVWCKRGAA